MAVGKLQISLLYGQKKKQSYRQTASVVIKKTICFRPIFSYFAIIKSIYQMDIFSMETQFSQIPLSQKAAKVKIKIELSSEINITPFVARQKANVFLLTHLGNLLWAAEPKLAVTGENLRWMIPVMYTIPRHISKQVGELAMEVNTGEIILRESIPSKLNEIEEHVQHLYQTTSPSASS